MAFYKAYFDESRLYGGRNSFALSGVVFRQSRAAAFLPVWRRATGGKFHLTDVVRGKKYYNKSKFTVSERSAIIWEAVRLVNQYRMLTVACSCNVQDHEEVAGAKNFLGFRSPYGICAHFGMTALGNWLRRKRIPGKVAYVFEDGHQDAKDARELFKIVSQSRTLKDKYRHRSDTFLEKEEAGAVPLQAGDLVTGVFSRYQERPDQKILGIKIEDLYYSLSLHDPSKSVTAHLDTKKLQKFQDTLLLLWHG
ncbi:MAG TPA: hypothetical protein VKM72_30295 [Thermoanaerobaculia bacterium]|nr:hypothetical protein [Thermoanaerobaculia bacterium]